MKRQGASPDHGYVWIGGYPLYEGGQYIWTPGRWDRPPHPGGVWVAHHWVYRHGEWVLIEGHWR